jgi:hypothetical protein
VVCEEGTDSTPNMRYRGILQRFPGDSGTGQYGLAPECWTQYLRTFSPARPLHPILFLHELTSPSGNRRLVVVERPRANSESPRPIDELEWTVIESTNLGEPVAVRMSDRPAIHSGSIGGVYFSGQSDNVDHSHFTIRFVSWGGRECTIDGHLRDDDSVVLSIRR